MSRRDSNSRGAKGSILYFLPSLLLSVQDVSIVHKGFSNIYVKLKIGRGWSCGLFCVIRGQESDLRSSDFHCYKPLPAREAAKIQGTR
eukprot:scaffold226508_cov15-Tisochrysis_lutea.AAC.1